MAREASVERNTKETEIKLKPVILILKPVSGFLTIGLTVLQDRDVLISAFVSMVIWM